MTDYKDRVSGWVSDIDWSKAPEGYPVWIEDLAPDKGFDGSGWHRDDGDRYTDEDGEYWTKPEKGIYRVHRQAPQWNGDGLPPVGASVVLDDSEHGVFDDYRAMIGVPVVVAAAFKSPTGVEMIACALPGGLCGCFRADMAHPTKTPAQIAAEARETAAVELAGILAGHDHHIAVRDIEMAKYLYDIGYRRTEKGDDK